jgi:hypothetical protein
LSKKCAEFATIFANIRRGIRETWSNSSFDFGVGVGKKFADSLDDASHFFRARAAALNAAADGIQEGQPVFKAGVFDQFPFVKAFLANVKKPFAAEVMGINLKALAFVSGSFPANFRFGRHKKN